MPSLPHEILVGLFRGNGELAAELLRDRMELDAKSARAGSASNDLSQLVPTEYRADAVTIMTDAAGRPVAGVVVEVQRHVKPNKRWAWPAYVANLRAKLKCKAMLLVIAPDPKVAAWARRTIVLGPGFRMRPTVIGFEDVPQVRDRDAALKLPELSVLSALAHPDVEIAEVAIGAAFECGIEDADVYCELIMKALPAEDRQHLEVKVERYKSEFARKSYGQGHEDGKQEGLQTGRQEGLQTGLQTGRQEGLRDAAVACARRKLKKLSSDDVAAIEALSDQAALIELVSALGAARSPAGVRATLNRTFGVGASGAGPSKGKVRGSEPGAMATVKRSKSTRAA